MNKNQLDEMQLQKRNKIGNQSFLLLVYLLFIEMGLNGFGITWLSYPMNIFVITLACLTLYQVRIIWNNAYLGPTNSKTMVKRLIVIGLFAVAAAVAAAVLLKNVRWAKSAETGDNSALILFIISGVGVILTIIISAINYRQNKNSDS